MKATDKFQEYLWLINTIRNAHRISLPQIQARWKDSPLSEGNPMPRITFARIKDEIEMFFGITIECDRRDGYLYYIKDEHILRGETMQNWLLNTFTVNNVISDNLLLHDRIFMESIPADEHLETLLTAMKKGLKVEMAYQKYGTDEVSIRTLEPYCLKVYQRRWYLLGRNDKGHLVTFSFDRIRDLRITKQPFLMDPEFNAQEYFADCYGVMHDERIEPQRIVLRAHGMERYYLEDLPLHASQRKLREGDGYTDFVLNVRASSDFMGRLMSRGSWLQVLEPESVVKDMKMRLMENLQRYV